MLNEITKLTQYTVTVEKNSSVDSLSEKYNIPSNFLSFQGYGMSFSMKRMFNDIHRGYIFLLVNRIWRKYMDLNPIDKIIDKDLSESKVATIYVACEAHGYHLTIREDSESVSKLKAEIARLKSQIDEQGGL